MSARILPLKGKYYGTVVEFDHNQSVTVWLSGFYDPSERQLAEWGFASYAEFAAANAEDGGDYTCDGHYETEGSYRAAERIRAALEDFA